MASGSGPLLLDSILPSDCSALLQQAVAHAPGVWILKQSKDRGLDSDLAALKHIGAALHAGLPSESLIVHKCWEEAHWDTYSAHFKTLLWYTSGRWELQHQGVSSATKFRHCLSKWGRPEHDFHWTICILCISIQDSHVKSLQISLYMQYLPICANSVIFVYTLFCPFMPIFFQIMLHFMHLALYIIWIFFVY